MPISETIERADVEDFYLDPLNPRLGRRATEAKLSQEDILQEMRQFTLDELAISFLESGFWPQEPLMVVQEKIHGKGLPQLVVVEGNRRLAAVKLLLAARRGEERSRKWRDIADSASEAQIRRLARLPYLVAARRKDIKAYLGFRHVTGIKEWAPAEKAEFIAKLIDEDGLNYVAVMRTIGSTVESVRRNYISYKLLLQMEEHADDFDLDKVEENFSVLYLSLRTAGAQKYLNIDIKADPKLAQTPVPPEHLRNLSKFALWLFGTSKVAPLVPESRQVDKFGRILLSREAIDYLETADSPNFDRAFRIAGGDEAEIVKLIEAATYNVEECLSTAHHHVDSRKLQKAVRRLSVDVDQLANLFARNEKPKE